MTMVTRQNVCLAFTLAVVAAVALMADDMSILQMGVIVGVSLRLLGEAVSRLWGGVFGENLLVD
jgi:hypothetical protein